MRHLKIGLYILFYLMILTRLVWIQLRPYDSAIDRDFAYQLSFFSSNNFIPATGVCESALNLIEKKEILNIKPLQAFMLSPLFSWRVGRHILCILETKASIWNNLKQIQYALIIGTCFLIYLLTLSLSNSHLLAMIGALIVLSRGSFVSGINSCNLFPYISFSVALYLLGLISTSYKDKTRRILIWSSFILTGMAAPFLGVILFFHLCLLKLFAKNLLPLKWKILGWQGLLIGILVGLALGIQQFTHGDSALTPAAYFNFKTQLWKDIYQSFDIHTYCSWIALFLSAIFMKRWNQTQEKSNFFIYGSLALVLGLGLFIFGLVSQKGQIPFWPSSILNFLNAINLPVLALSPIAGYNIFRRLKRFYHERDQGRLDAKDHIQDPSF